MEVAGGEGEPLDAAGVVGEPARRSGAKPVREGGQPGPGPRRGRIDGGVARRSLLAPRAASRAVLYGVEELVPGGDELLDTLLDQDLDHVVVVDAGVGERPACGRPRRRRTGRTWSPLMSPWSATAFMRRLGHRVHGVLDHEVVDVHRVAVVGVLDAGRGPQRPLLARAVGLERLPALAGEGLLVGLVGQPGVGDAGLALEVRVGARRRRSWRRAACRSRCRRGRRRTTRPSGWWSGRGRSRGPSRGRRRGPP